MVGGECPSIRRCWHFASDYGLGVRLMTQPSLKALLDSNQTIIETDFTAEPPKNQCADVDHSGRQRCFDALDLTGRRTAKLIPGAQLKVHEGAPHGLMFTHIDRFNADLVAFIKSFAL
jgi:pimeloyl-ACP methyl ester carboxylesterase